jgi:glycosyltransferase involved in cell wall biosynthesis
MITYGHEKFIREAIEGVLSQKCSYEIELIIADDNSPDKTKEIVEDIIKNHPNGSWIKYTRHQENKGMMPNFIWALQQSKAEYIALCEGDDYWIDPLKLQKQIDFLDQNPDYVLCFHKVKILSSDKSFEEDYIEERFNKIKSHLVSRKDLLEQGNFIHTPSAVFRNITNDFPQEIYKSPVGDYLLHILLAKHGYIKRLDDTMAVYRKGVGVYSSLNNIEMYKKIIKYNMCILSFLTDEEERKIILDKLLNQIDQLSELVKNEPISTSDFVKKKIKKILKH